MALGNLTKNLSAGADGAVVFCDHISLVGDGAYPTGGSTGLKAKLDAATKSDRTIIAVIPQKVPAGKRVDWDRANAKLLVYVEDAVSGIEAEVGAAENLSGDTYELLVISK